VKFKLDENFGNRTYQLFAQAGHDVETVYQEVLSGTPDENLYRTCHQEQRCLVTLDLDFADVTRFPPDQSSGIVVIRVSRNPSLALLEHMISQLLQVIATTPMTNQLWIVETDRIRIHQSK
jgi:predicted nuclease of predicted toxin-antitoxin system